MGSQEERTGVVSGTDCPLWDASMQFQVKDLLEDTLCITVFDKGYYSPDGKVTIIIPVSTQLFDEEWGQATKTWMIFAYRIPWPSRDKGR